MREAHCLRRINTHEARVVAAVLTTCPPRGAHVVKVAAVVRTAEQAGTAVGIIIAVAVAVANACAARILAVARDRIGNRLGALLVEVCVVLWRGES